MASESREELVNSSPPLPFDTSVAHVARVYNYWLGGKDNFAADRAAGEQAIKAFPEIGLSARSNRAFLARAVRFLAGDCGVRQFLDIGTGIPTAGNTHEVAQSVAPESRVVYVDYDPIVLAHARALLTSHEAGATEYIDADLRDTDTILAQAARVLDFSQPVAITLVAILHAIPDSDDPYGIVGLLKDTVPAGSYVALSHGGTDLLDPEVMAGVIGSANRRSQQQYTPRSREQVMRFFDGMDLVDPGLVRLEEWRPAPDTDTEGRSSLWCGVGRKR